MSRSSSGWSTGCGIGCGVVIFLLIIIVFGGYLVVKNIVKNYNLSGDSMDELVAQYGDTDAYTPDPGGEIEAERLEIFLSVREAMAAKRDEVAASLQVVADKLAEQDESALSVLKILRTGIKVVPQIAEYLTIRNESLLEYEMGIGEYYYIYVSSYYAYLDKSPGDGPQFRLIGSEAETFGDGLTIGTSDEEAQQWYGEGVRAERLLRNTRYSCRMLLSMFERQLREIDELAAGERSNAFTRALEKEITALEEDVDRLPWSDGLPSALRGSLRPFKERLDAQYSPSLNPFELLPDRTSDLKVQLQDTP